MWNVPDIVSLAKQATFVTLRGRPALDDLGDRRKLWDIRYTRHGRRAFDRGYEAWLARWEYLWAGLPAAGTRWTWAVARVMMRAI